MLYGDMCISRVKGLVYDPESNYEVIGSERLEKVVCEHAERNGTLLVDAHFVSLSGFLIDKQDDYVYDDDQPAEESGRPPTDSCVFVFALICHGQWCAESIHIF